MATHIKIKKLVQTAVPRHVRHLILHFEVKKYCRKHFPYQRRQTEKPDTQFQRYKNYRMLIRLRLWCITAQANSLMQAQYSQEPRDPE